MRTKAEQKRLYDRYVAGRAQFPAAPPGQSADPQRDLQEALRGIEDNLSFEDAIRILNLLDQLNAQQKGQPNQPQGTNGPDY